MSDALVTVDILDDLIHNAKPVPLSDQVRLDPDEIQPLLDQLRLQVPPEGEQHVDRLDALMRDAKPIPLTRRVRLHKEDLYEALDAIRGTLGPRPG